MMIDELLVGIILCLPLRRSKLGKIMVYIHKRGGGCAATIGGYKQTQELQRHTRHAIDEPPRGCLNFSPETKPCRRATVGFVVLEGDEHFCIKARDFIATGSLVLSGDKDYLWPSQLEEPDQVDVANTLR